MTTTPEKPKSKNENLDSVLIPQTSYPYSDLWQTKKRTGIGALFTIPFWPVPLVIIAGAIGWVSWDSGKAAVNQLAIQLQAEATQRVEEELETYLSVPHRLNQINVDSIESGVIEANEFDKISRLFWQQMQVFEIGYISYGTADGRFIGVGKMPNGAFSIDELLSPEDGEVYFYNVDRQGNRSEQPRRIIQDYQPREDAWYADAATAQKSLWSSIYRWQPWYGVGSKSDVISISASSPIYDQQGNVSGVIGTELPITEISSFLEDLDISKIGEVFIMERDGRLVATSTDESIIVADGERKLAINSQTPLIQKTATYLEQEFETLENIDGTTSQLSYEDGNTRQFLQVIPWQDEYGLDWLIVATVPEAAFMGEINTIRDRTLILMVVALAVAAGLGTITTRWVSRPLRQLSDVTEEVASGNLEARAKKQGTVETQTLAANFNNLVERVQELLKEQEETASQQRLQREELEAEVLQLMNDVEKAADGDLTVRAQLMEGDIGIVADLFNAIIENLQETAQQVKVSASRVSESLGENETSLREAAETSIEEAEQIQATLNSVETMTHSIQEVADNAQKTANIADKAFSTAQKGNEAMTETVKSIQELRSTVGATAIKMKELGESATKIAKVVSVIDEISLKTTLLAANASMEAHRTGELGQGFTAVAEQVEALAEQSASAAKEIAQLVIQIQTQTEEAIETMELGTTEVLESARSVEASQVQLAEVVARSEEINKLMQSISHSTVSQAEISQAVSQLMEQVARSSQQRSHTSQQVAEAIQETAQVAKRLEASMEQFKVE